MPEPLAIHDWDLVTTNLGRITSHSYTVAVLPLAAVEAHNRHLPQGQDLMHTTWVARECCRRAWSQCQSIICLPPIPFGVDCNQLGFPMAIHVSQSTLDTLVCEIITSLRHHGVRKIVLLNGHGGNAFKPLIRQLQCDMDVFVFLCDWWTVGSDRYDEIFDRPDDHAGQMETSVALALYPELVEMDRAGDGKPRPFRFEALRKGWVTTSRDFTKLNDHCAAGEPGGASAERGRRYLDLACERVSAFLVELAREPIDEAFPHVTEG